MGIWSCLLVFYLISQLFAALACEILSWTLEEKFHISVHPYVILYFPGDILKTSGIVLPIQTSLLVINNFVYLCCSYRLKWVSVQIVSIQFDFLFLCVCYSLCKNSNWVEIILTEIRFNLQHLWPNVARVWFPDPVSYVGWVCWLSTLHQEVFSSYSGLPSPQKPAFDLICINC